MNKNRTYLVRELKIYWQEFRVLEHNFYKQVKELESNIEHNTGIRGIEIFFCDNEGAVGIGSRDRTLPLILRNELED